MDLNIHFVDQASGFPLNTLIGPALQLIIGGVSVWVVTWYKGALDRDADEKKRAFDDASQARGGEISTMLQAHEKEMNKQQIAFQSELEAKAIEHKAALEQIAFRTQQLHLRRGKVIEDFHSLLLKTCKALEYLECSQNQETSSSRFEAFFVVNQELKAFERAKRLYFTIAFGGTIQRLFSLMDRTAEFYRTLHNGSQRGDASTFVAIAAVMATETNAALRNLENEFRKLLGVEKDET
jgi:hypothetical protein